MPEIHSREGKRVERIRVSDQPHERYRKIDPSTGEELTIDNQIPILTSTKKGNVVDKEVSRYNVSCPECHKIVRYNHNSEPICSSCGIICSGQVAELEVVMVRDAKAAGRCETSEK